MNCGSGKDRIDTDGLDKLTSCERTGLPAPTPDPDVPGLGPLPDEAAGTVGGVRKITTPGRIVPIPGFPGERIDSRLLPDIRYLKAKYHIFITDGYSLQPIHVHGGEHPLGLAIDIIPGPGGSWDDIDRLAKWAEPQPEPHARAVPLGGLQRRRQPRSRQPPPPVVDARARAVRARCPVGDDVRRQAPARFGPVT